MKRFAPIALAATLAVSGWASVPGQPTTALPSANAFQGGSCPTPAATVDTSKLTWKHGTAEYNDFKAAASATSPAQKAQLAAAFLAKYPDSDYKTLAMQLEMGGQAQAPGGQADAVKTAETLIKSGSADATQMLQAYVVVAALEPGLLQPNDPDLAAKTADLSQAATCGQQMLSSAPAPQQAQFGPIFTKAQGFAQLNQKDYSGAIATLTKAVEQNPKDALPYYWMGVAEVTQQSPNYDAGIFDLARASVLAPQTGAIKSYLDTVYTTYHGSLDGLDQVITAATNNTTPPQGFTIESKVDIENAQAQAQYQAELEKAKNTPPPENSFVGIEWRLKRPDYAAEEWKKVKGQGYELTGLVTDVTAKTVDIAVGATDPSTPADVHLILAAPLGAKRPKVGEKVDFKGVVESYKPNPPDQSAPFLLTMDQASVTGFSPEAPKASGGGGR